MELVALSPNFEKSGFVVATEKKNIWDVRNSSTKGKASKLNKIKGRKRI